MMFLTEFEQKIQNHQHRVITSDLPKAAVLVPLTTTPSGQVSELIFTRRASHMSKHSGEVAFPGGKQDPSDPNLAWTALRESQEEINLKPSDVRLIGSLGPVISRFGIEVTPFVGSVPEGLEFKANTQELDRIFTVPIDFLADSRNLRFDRWQMQDKVYTMPSYQFGEYLIWGLTAIMLVEFLNITLNANIPLDPPQFSTKHSASAKKQKENS